MKNPTEVTNTMSPAAAMPGMTSGNVTRKKASAGRAPSDVAAACKRGSIDSSTGRMVMTANGISPCTIPTSTALKLNSSDAPAGAPVSSSMMPLTGPFLPKSTSQAKDLTRKLVQNGSSTSSCSTTLRRPPARHMRAAMGNPPSKHSKVVQAEISSVRHSSERYTGVPARR